MSMNRDDIAAMREEYGSRELLREDLNEDPTKQFESWFDEAVAAQLNEPNAVVLSTLGLDDFPVSRTLLMKSFDERGFVLYTNYTSAKAQEIEAHPKVNILFPWWLLERQVRVEGIVEKVSREESQAYFSSRPRASQIGAWVSHQSKVIDSRFVLDERMEKLEARFEGADVPLPDFWGGYRVKPTRFEFWQGGKGRVHDRFLYEKKSNAWSVARLAP